MICVIIPTLNSAASLFVAIKSIITIADDIIVSDGGSEDATISIAVQNGARLAVGCSGRGRQLARACDFSHSDWILCLHADTRLSKGFENAIRTHIANHSDKAGYFKLRFDASGWKPRLIEVFVAIRCRMFGLPYGDQGLLISRDLYGEIGGYEKIDLFEDVAIVRAIGKRRLRCLPAFAITDASKFERDGYFRRGFRNFRLLRRFLKGDAIKDLHRIYTQ